MIWSLGLLGSVILSTCVQVLSCLIVVVVALSIRLCVLFLVLNWFQLVWPESQV